METVPRDVTVMESHIMHIVFEEWRTAKQTPVDQYKKKCRARPICSLAQFIYKLISLLSPEPPFMSLFLSDSVANKNKTCSLI